MMKPSITCVEIFFGFFGFDGPFDGDADTTFIDADDDVFVSSFSGASRAFIDITSSTTPSEGVATRSAAAEAIRGCWVQTGISAAK